MQAALGEWESPWRELGVPADADSGTIKKAYRKLVLQCEPPSRAPLNSSLPGAALPSQYRVSKSGVTVP